MQCVEHWDCDDVIAWFKSKGMGVYGNIFQEYKVTGVILLNLSASDLDGMHIASLKQRKVYNPMIFDSYKLNGD